MRFNVYIAVGLSAKENTSHYSTSLNPCMLPVDRLVRKPPAKTARLIAALFEKTPWWIYMESYGLSTLVHSAGISFPIHSCPLLRVIVHTDCGGGVGLPKQPRHHLDSGIQLPSPRPLDM